MTGSRQCFRFCYYLLREDIGHCISIKRPVLDVKNEHRPPIICFSHLRWDFVFQRPQHILSRLAAEHPIYYVEEPEHSHENVRPRLLERYRPATSTA